ncbi:MAG: RIP metalloprotease RseP [Desulfuromonadaceae bacterium]|nr:RIP metalloprotease RseP [Desulfuromonadaceae bacterium]MDD2848769.1 RIP metalloprotease RseP [Desulfuromonadaceae bacterium]MDD4130419.1 RIP metalloprotease RseP [Desulfuromonadaceae bacterium]
MTVIYAIIVLGVLIFVHELGHFLFAKMMGVRVEKFSLGFGPKLLGTKIGETEYLLSAFPLGGYVKMFGEGGFIEGSETHHQPENGTDATIQSDETMPGELTEYEKSRSFSHKPVLARIVIVMAGPVFNLLFAWLIFMVICTMGVPTLTTKIGEALKDKPAAKAGMQKGDIITAINNKPTNQWEQIAEGVAASKGQPLTIVVKRDSRDMTFSITPEPRTSKNLFGESINGYVIGVASAGEIVSTYYGPYQAVIVGSKQTWKVIDLTIMSLVKMAQRVVPMDSVGGPIMIAKMAGEQASAGGASFLAFMALLSINLGVLNLLPVPVLDGGHLLFYFMELIFRRPVPQKVREFAQQIGMVLLLGLMVLAFYNDIIRYFFSTQG